MPSTTTSRVMEGPRLTLTTPFSWKKVLMRAKLERSFKSLSRWSSKSGGCAEALFCLVSWILISANWEIVVFISFTWLSTNWSVSSWTKSSCAESWPKRVAKFSASRTKLPRNTLDAGSADKFRAEPKNWSSALLRPIEGPPITSITRFA